MEKIEKFKVGEIQPFPDGSCNDICKVADKINELAEKVNEIVEWINAQRPVIRNAIRGVAH